MARRPPLLEQMSSAQPQDALRYWTAAWTSDVSARRIEAFRVVVARPHADIVRLWLDQVGPHFTWALSVQEARLAWQGGPQVTRWSPRLNWQRLSRHPACLLPTRDDLRSWPDEAVLWPKMVGGLLRYAPAVLVHRVLAQTPKGHLKVLLGSTLNQGHPCAVHHLTSWSGLPGPELLRQFSGTIPQPLHQAARKGQSHLLRLLDRWGCSWKEPDTKGLTALDHLHQDHPVLARSWERTLLARTCAVPVTSTLPRPRI